MQQYFINELQAQHAKDQKLQLMVNKNDFINELPNMSLADLEIILPQSCMAALEMDSKLAWVNLGMIMNQIHANLSKVDISKEMYLQLCLKIYANLINLLNSRITSVYLEIVLMTFYKITMKVDQQFWAIVAWYFRNNPNNVYQLELLRYLIIHYSTQQEFIGIFILKIKLETTKQQSSTVQTILLKSIKLLLELNRYDIIDDQLYQYLLSFQNLDSIQEIEYYAIISLLEIYYEKIPLNEWKNYQLFSQTLIERILQLFMIQKCSKEVCIIISRFCTNKYALQILKKCSQDILKRIFVLLCNEISQNYQKMDDPHEILDLITKQKSDNYINSLVRLFKDLNQNLFQFSLISFSSLSFIISQSFQEMPISQNIEIGKIQFKIISNNYLEIQTFSIQTLATSIILLATLRKLIIKSLYLLENTQRLIRQNLQHFFIVSKEPCFQNITIFFVHSFIKHIFKAEQDEELQLAFVSYCLNQIMFEDFSAIIVFNSITKSKNLYCMLKRTLPLINDKIVHLIHHFQDSDFLQSLLNLAKFHQEAMERFSQDYLIALQERIKIEIENRNYHAVIKLLQCYTKILKVYLKENIFNEKYQVFSILEYFRESKRGNFELEMINLSKVYFAKTQCKDMKQLRYAFGYVFEYLEQSTQAAICFKFINTITSYCSADLYDQSQDLLNLIILYCQRALEMQYMQKVVKNILTNLIQASSITQISEFSQYIASKVFNQEKNDQNIVYLDLMCEICSIYLEQTEMYHNQLIGLIQQNFQIMINDQFGSSQIQSQGNFLIQLFGYYQANYGRTQRELEFQLLNTQIEIFHKTLLYDDKLESLPQMYKNFQEMINLNEKGMETLIKELNQKQKFKFDQLMLARAQLGLVNVIYNKFSI